MSKELPEAMAVMGFAFYVAPMLLPLRAEMPAGDSLLENSIASVIVMKLKDCKHMHGNANLPFGITISTQWSICRLTKSLTLALSLAGAKGDRIASRATILVVVVISQLIYGCLGVFGAARHGLATSGNVLANEWLPLRAQVIGKQA